MKIGVVMIFIFFYPFIVNSQQILQVGFENKNDVKYLTFKSNNCSTNFVDSLNNYFGYENSLKCQYLEAPNAFERATTIEIKGIIDSIQKGEVIGSLADISYEIDYNDNCLLSISKNIVPEGKKKNTNSFVSEYPYSFPKIYNLKRQKVIRSVNDFLTKEGEIDIKSIIKSVMCKRAYLYFQNKTDHSCDIGQTSLNEFLDNEYSISNNSEHIDIYSVSDKLFYYFYFSNQGLELDNNSLGIEFMVCAGIDSRITIPWIDLQDYCIKSDSNIIFNICKTINKKVEKSEWIVESDYVNLLVTPNELGVFYQGKVEPCILKEEKVEAIAQSGEFLKIKYVASNGSVKIGWVKTIYLK